MKRNPFNMEKNGSIYSSTHYIPGVILCNQFDPTAIEQKRNFSIKARKKAFKKINLFKQNAFTKIPKSMGGGKKIHGSDFGSWGIVNHLIEDDQAGIYIYYRSPANTIITKRNKFKQLKLI